MKKIYAFFISVVIASTSLAAANWKASAVKLSGDPEIRQQGIKELKAIEGLPELLRESFKADRELVLQVINALEMKEFTPRLLEIISFTNGKELSFEVIAAATNLASDKNQQELTILYYKKLDSPDISDAATLALLSGLKKFKYPIAETKLLSYLKHPSYEIRISAVQIAQALLNDKKAYDKVFQKAITAAPYQVRMIAYSEFKANAELRKSYATDLTKACTQEKNEKNKAICLQLEGSKK